MVDMGESAHVGDEIDKAGQALRPNRRDRGNVLRLHHRRQRQIINLRPRPKSKRRQTLAGVGAEVVLE